jgi:hypothetical protein
MQIVVAFLSYNSSIQTLHHYHLKHWKKADGTEHTNKERDNKNEIDLIDILLGDNPQLIVSVLLDDFRQGKSEEELAEIVALRIAQFDIRNEFADWDAALHTFTFANV